MRIALRQQLRTALDFAYIPNLLGFLQTPRKAFLDQEEVKLKHNTFKFKFNSSSAPQPPLTIQERRVDPTCY